jgi:hypothetical protein
MKDKTTRLFYILGSFFVANAILAEFIGVKVFSLEKTFGMLPLNLSILGYKDLSFNLSAGVLLWPVVFIMTDIINEYFGRRGVRFLSFTAAALILYSFLMVFLSTNLIPADSGFKRYSASGINMHLAFKPLMDRDVDYRRFSTAFWLTACRCNGISFKERTGNPGWLRLPALPGFSVD